LGEAAQLLVPGVGREPPGDDLRGQHRPGRGGLDGDAHAALGDDEAQRFEHAHRLAHHGAGAGEALLQTGEIHDVPGREDAADDLLAQHAHHLAVHDGCGHGASPPRLVGLRVTVSGARRTVGAAAMTPRPRPVKDARTMALTPYPASDFPEIPTAIVTGAASERGIGRATANRLARDGWAVAVLDLDEAASAAVAEEITREHGTPALGLGVDIADEQ